MIRHMDYIFPGMGYGGIREQFMMGDFLLVAPQVEKGATSRMVAVPPGTWLADDGTKVTGPTEIVVKTPLERLPYFEKFDER
jgi:alpha-glucosidase (family GH31 glycosyl hydrolase)